MTLLAATTTTVALPDWLNADHLLQGLGPYMFLGLALFIFADCGLLIGFLIPGDTMLFVGGLFIARGLIGVPLWLACVILSICAIVGNVVGYWIGRGIGPRLFDRPDSRFFKHEHVERTHAFFEKYGARAIVIARFVPIVRTFITAIAGVGRMDVKQYFTYSAVGGVLWATGITVAGYFLGQIEFVHSNLEIFVLAIPIISIVPIIVEAVKARNERKSRPAASELEQTQQMETIQD